MADSLPNFTYWAVANHFLESEFVLVDAGRWSVSETKWMAFGPLLSLRREPPKLSGEAPADALRVSAAALLPRIDWRWLSLLQDPKLIALEVEDSDEAMLPAIVEVLAPMAFVQIGAEFRYSPNVVITKRIGALLVDEREPIAYRATFYRASATNPVIQSCDGLLKRVMLLDLHRRKEMARDLIEHHSDLLPDWCARDDVLKLLSDEERKAFRGRPVVAATAFLRRLLHGTSPTLHSIDPKHAQ